MDRTAVEALAGRLASARLARSLVEPAHASAAPASDDEGYLVQRQVHALLGSAGWGDVVGYKVGCTAPEQQRALGLSGPAAGGLLANRVYLSGATVKRGDFHSPGVECEIAVTLGAELKPQDTPYDEGSVAASIAACHPAIEVIDRRYSNIKSMNAATLIGDDMFHAIGILGPASAPPEYLQTMHGELMIDDRIIAGGLASNLMGHPYAVVAWLANTMARWGQPLRAGQVVLCGSVTPAAWLDNHQSGELTVTARFTKLGEARIHFV